ncbi:MAG TPA: zinc-ribbon domain-containing protein [Terriglobales bacterium]|nr:zinc-ribbon domain-containing protein [Terriglobales bacterium]HXY14555.1 zinc-ribbon domain-containing protein [Terriglobales bacterium]
MAFCTSCGAQIPAGASVCPACNRAASPAAGATGSAATGAAPGTVQGNTGGLTDNVAGALAYVTIIPSILFLVMAPYNRNRFIRFHSFQNIFFAVAWIALWIVLNIVAHIPIFGWLTILIWPLIGLAGFVIWIVLILKAYQGQMFKLPMIGDMAQKQADAM